MPRVLVEQAVQRGCLVTSPASDQRFALPCDHQAKPGRNLFAPVAIEVGQLAEMVYLHTGGGATQFANVRLEQWLMKSPRS
jgi:hypothetical protein